MAFLYVFQADVLHDFLLAVVQVLGLGQMNAFGPHVLPDDIVGLAHTVSSRLDRKIQSKYRLLLFSVSVQAFCMKDLMKASFFVPLASHRHSVSSLHSAAGG